MANDAPHYRDLAARAHVEAEAATLDNVRNRALRSAAAFESMALQHETAARRRAEREAQIASAMAADTMGDDGEIPSSTPTDQEQI